MNIQNLNRVAEWLEAGAPHVIFNMLVGIGNVDELIDVSGHSDCGTVCCIAGAAQLMSVAPEGQEFPDIETQIQMQQNADWADTEEVALEWLGLQDDSLFSFHQAPDNCTPLQAAAAVRRVMAGQEPWTCQ